MPLSVRVGTKINVMAKILIIDDRPANREFLVTLLGYKGHQLLESGDGATGLTIARKEKPGLIIVDIVMPEMDGYEFIRQLRSDKAIAKIPVIFYTASYLEKEARSLAEMCEVKFIITKPSEPEEVLEKVHTALEMPVSASVPKEEFDRTHMQVLTNKLSEKVDELTVSNAELEQKRESLSLFRALIDRSNDAIEVIDPETGRFLDVNETGCTRLGYTREEMLRLSLPDIQIDPFAAVSLHERMDELRKAGSDTVEGWQKRKDGSTFPVEVNVRHIHLNRDYLVAVVRDITERKQVAERIEEQAALLDQAQDAIIVCGVNGRVSFWSKGAERTYGWKRDEAVGRKITDMLYDDDTAKHEECLALVLEEGEWSGELRQFTKDGEKLIVEARWSLVRDKDGAPKSILAINTDVTERKKIEAQFLRTQRMESIGTVAGGVAHDLNNILSPILVSIDLLKDIVNDPLAASVLETIENSARRGADIVRQILSFARGMEGQRVELQPRHLIKDVEHIVKSTFPKNIRLQLYVPSDTWAVVGDPTQLHQVLLNLCVNARDAMPNGGVLSLKAENRMIDEQYAVMKAGLEAKAGPYIIISVGDSGTGIPGGIIDKIFDPFFTTKEVGQGTGLGLSTVAAIVKSHRGFINVDSEPGKGSIFRVNLPAIVYSESPPQTGHTTALPRGKGESILVIDDEKAILTITGQTLQTYGYKVLTATNGAAGTAVYAQNVNDISVVLTDMMMPVLDGPSTIRALRQLNPDVKIIAMSGLSTNSSVTSNPDLGVTHFLAKPYTAGKLLKLLRAVIEGTDEQE